MADILQAIIWNWYSSLKKVEFWFKFHSPVKNRSCSESTRCCVQCVIPLIWYPSVFLTDGSESSGWDFGNNNGRRKCVFEILRLAFEIGLQPVKQFAQSWNLPCCQCTETCSYISSIQNDIRTTHWQLFIHYMKSKSLPRWILWYIYIVGEREPSWADAQTKFRTLSKGFSGICP